MESTIGVGGQAQVQQATDRMTGDKVAVKIFRKRKMNFVDLVSAYREHDLMKRMDREVIQSPLAYFECTRYILIVYELMASDVRSLLLEFGQQPHEE